MTVADCSHACAEAPEDACYTYQLTLNPLGAFDLPPYSPREPTRYVSLLGGRRLYLSTEGSVNDELIKLGAFSQPFTFRDPKIGTFHPPRSWRQQLEDAVRSLLHLRADPAGETRLTTRQFYGPLAGVLCDTDGTKREVAYFHELQSTPSKEQAWGSLACEEATQADIDQRFIDPSTYYTFHPVKTTSCLWRAHEYHKFIDGLEGVLSADGKHAEELRFTVNDGQVAGIMYSTCATSVHRPGTTSVDRKDMPERLARFHEVVQYLVNRTEATYKLHVVSADAAATAYLFSMPAETSVFEQSETPRGRQYLLLGLNQANFEIDP